MKRPRPQGRLYRDPLERLSERVLDRALVGLVLLVALGLITWIMETL